MTFLQKLGIRMERSIYRVSSHVDEFLNRLITEGEFMGIEHLYIQVKYKGVNYFIWKPDLSVCLERNMETYVYSHLSPSVETKIRFWEWVEEKSEALSARKLPLSVRKITRILEQ